MKLKFLTFIILFLSNLAYSATATDASIEKLLQYMQIEKKNSELTPIFIENLFSNTSNIFDDRKKLSEEQNKKLSTIDQKYKLKLLESIKWKNINNLYIKAFRETYTQEEIDFLIDFFKNPIANNVFDKMVKLNTSVKDILMLKFTPIAEEWAIELSDATEPISKSSSQK